jgi:hypothetical protein
MAVKMSLKQPHVFMISATSTLVVSYIMANAITLCRQK